MSEAELLKKLMTCFYPTLSGLAWSYIEGTTLREVLGKEVEDKLKEYLFLRRK